MRLGKRDKRLSSVAPLVALVMCGCVAGEPGEPDVDVDLASSQPRVSPAAQPVSRDIVQEGAASCSTVTSAYGVLVFPDEGSAQQCTMHLASMSSEDRQSWEADLGFTSQDTLYELINEAEIQLEEERFGHLDPNLSIAELRRMGYEEQHTALYDSSLGSGYIREVVEEDDSRSFELVSGYPAYSSILTPDGHVVIGDELRRYRQGALDVTALPDLDELAKDVDGLFDDATRDGRQPIRTLVTHTWHHDSGWVYEFGDGNRRFKIQLVGSGATGGSLMTVDHYLTADSSKKEWGSWKRRNHYRPIRSMSGEWHYKYMMGLGSSIINLFSIPVSATYTPWLSPMKWTPVPGGTTNLAKTYLAPAGLWSPGGFDYFYDPVNMLGLTVRGHFTSTTVTLTHGGASPSPPPAYRLRHVNTGKCLYNLLGSTVRNWGCWPDPGMRYVLLPGYAGSVRLHHLDTGTCVRVGPYSGAQATSAICSPTDANQRFYLDSAGGGTVRLRANGQCLYGTPVDGNHVYNWGCWADPGLRFILDPA